MKKARTKKNEKDEKDEKEEKDEKKKEKRITLNRTYEMLCKEKCGTVRVIDEITINVCSVMTMLAERDMVEFAEKSKLVVGLPSSNPFVKT